MFLETHPNCFINTENLFKVVAHYDIEPGLEIWSNQGTYHRQPCSNNSEVKNLLNQLLGDQSQALRA